jgi:hypothetical protein
MERLRGMNGYQVKRGIIPSPFGNIRYYNTDNTTLVQSAVSRMYKMAEERQQFKSSQIAGTTNLDPTGIYYNIRGIKQGLFYFSLDFDQIYNKPFPIGTSQTDFGYHRDYFTELVNAGKLVGSDYEAYPRGFTVYDSLSQLYMIVCGSWLTFSNAEKLCNSLGFDPKKFPYVIVPNPAYDYQNNGKHKGKPYPFYHG